MEEAGLQSARMSSTLGPEVEGAWEGAVLLDPGCTDEYQWDVVGRL